MVCIEGEKAQLAVLEAIAIRLEAIAIRLEAIATRVEVLTSRPRRIDPEARIEPKGPNHMTLVAWSQPLRSLPTPSTALGVKRVDSGWLRSWGSQPGKEMVSSRHLPQPNRDLLNIQELVHFWRSTRVAGF